MRILAVLLLVGCATSPARQPDTFSDDLAQLKREGNALEYRARLYPDLAEPVYVLRSQIQALAVGDYGNLSLSEEELRMIEDAKGQAAARVLFSRSKRLRTDLDRGEYLARH